MAKTPKSITRTRKEERDGSRRAHGARESRLERGEGRDHIANRRANSSLHGFAN
jgi:hypothetical protein